MTARRARSPQRRSRARPEPLRIDRPAGPQLRGAILAQVDRARAACAAIGGSDADASRVAVHRLRRAGKRIRAWLRLVEAAAPEGGALGPIAEERQRWRAIMTACSARRDFDVSLAVFEQWCAALRARRDEDPRVSPLVEWLETLRAMGEAERDARSKESAVDVAALAASIDASRAALAGTESTERPADDLFGGDPFDAVTWPELVRAIGRSWRAARRSRRAWVDRRSADPEALHVTRKRTARLVFQLELVESIDPRRVRRWRRRLRRFADALGAHRDEGIAHAMAFDRLPPLGVDTPSMALLHEFTRRRDRRDRRALARRAKRALRGSGRTRARRLRRSL